ncbi:hypothetical protein BH23GEM10_BH23GEM10_07240 [soil metagenome]
MTDPDLIGLFIVPLETLDIPYMITGGVASVIYGDPRFTRDVDIVLALRDDDIDDLASAFASDLFYVPPIVALGQEVARSEGGHFNLIHRATALRADVYIAGTDALVSWAFLRRLRARVADFAIWVAPIEYVIVRKLEYFRMSNYDRHLRDVAMMLQISSDAIDEAALDHWIGLRGLPEELATARAYADD